MSITNGIYTWFFKKRLEQISWFKENPIEAQEQILKLLIKSAESTIFGKEYGFENIETGDQFKQRVPIRAYEDFKPYIDQVLLGKPDILWPGQTKWFAKSSGTTQDRSKFIPISFENIEDCHFQGGKDVFGVHLSMYPDSKVFDGRSLVLGGSHEINQLNQHSFYGDLSAVLTQNLPIWAELLRTPDLKTALHPNYEEKIELMAKKAIDKNVTNIVGVPTWTVVLLNRILDITKKDDILEVWPNLELYVHGGVSFEPYREIFAKLIPSTKMNYLETYNASEGFFAFQDDPLKDDMLLMLDNGIYYEFIPMDQLDNDRPIAIGLNEVELDKNYAIIISTNTGLWRYKIGDTIKFTSLYPFKIKVTGRTKHFINAFGEELIIENADKAIAKACLVTNSIVNDFTAAPVYFKGREKGGHEWLIEFKKKPDDLDSFTNVLDKTLCEVNSDYDAKRKNDMALKKPIVKIVPNGTFYNWLKSKGKLGGQNKVPRLKNDRSVIDDIIELITN